MSDTRKSIRLSDAISNARSPHLLVRKPPVREIWPATRNEILYRAAWREEVPWQIAKALSKGPVRLSEKQAYLVITRELRKIQSPTPSPAGVVPITKKAA